MNPARNWPICKLKLTHYPTNVYIDLGTGFNEPTISGNAAAANDVTLGSLATSDSTTLLSILDGGSLNATELIAGADNYEGAVSVAGANSTLVATFQYIGFSGNGTLTVSSGGSVSSLAVFDVGEQAGSNGNVTVTGANSTLSAPGILNVGLSGNGTLTVSNGGNVTAGSIAESVEPGATGNITVTGANSTLSLTGSLYDGESGNGTLTVSNGGNVSGGSLDIGPFPGSTGIATVDGAGSTASASYVFVGGDGNGTLTVSNGGNVTASSQFILGDDGGSAGTLSVDGLGSVAGSSGFFIVGEGGSSVANVTNGGAIAVTGEDGEDEGVYLGYESGENSSLLISGVNSVGNVSSSLNVTEGGVAVGLDGNGTLTVADGAVANLSGRDSNDAGLDIGQEFDGTGSVTVTGVNPVGNLASTLNVTQTR
jgi:T5SS/PEP-CTERM-associated repeat protein